MAPPRPTNPQQMAQASVIPGSQDGHVITNPQQMAQASVIPGSQGLAAHAPAAAPAAPPAPTYAELYQQALSHANYGVGQQFGLALNDIAAREAQASQSMQGLPQHYDTVFGNATASQNQNAQAMQQAFQNAHMQNFIDPNAFLQPIQMALSANQAAYKADVPTLQGAMSAEFGRQRSEVEQARAAAQAEAQQRAQAQAHDEANMQLQHQWDVEARREDRQFQGRQNKAERRAADQDWRSKMGLQHQYDMETFQAQQDAEVVDPVTGLTGGQRRKAQQSDAYKNFNNKILAGKRPRSTNIWRGITSGGRDWTDRESARPYSEDEIDDMIDASHLPPAVKNALRYDLLAHATTASGKTLPPGMSVG